MAVKDDLMLAILAMDAYNRGYDAEMLFPGLARVARIKQSEEM
jgi:hypothetical protein